LNDIDPQDWLADLLKRIAEYPAEAFMSCFPCSGRSSSSEKPPSRGNHLWKITANITYNLGRWRYWQGRTVPV